MALVKVSAVLLAAGLSSRMGGENKMLLDFGGKKVIQRTLENLEASNVAEVVLILGNKEREIRSVLKDTADKTRLIPNPRFSLGMSTSIQCGASSINPSSQGVMVCLGDMPLILPEEYNELIEFFAAAHHKNPQSIVVPFMGKHRAHPVIFSSAYLPEILRHEELNGCKGLIKSHTEHVREFQTNRQSLITDLDTPQDYRLALQAFSEIGGGEN